MDILCCPTCKGALDLSVEKQENDEVIKGQLICQHCDVIYDIKDGIPHLLPKPMKKS